MMMRFNKYNFVEEYKKTKNGMKTNVGPVKPVLDSNYAEFDNNCEGTKDPTVRNSADYSRTTEVSITRSQDNGEVCPEDVIIDSIIKSDDLSLLSSTYKKNMRIVGEKEKLGQIDENLFKKFAAISAHGFLDFIESIDTNTLVQNKSEWLQHSENFSSLLDDVLRSFGHNMDLDCY